LATGDTLVLDKKQIAKRIERELLKIGFEPVLIEWFGSSGRPIIRLRIDWVTLGSSNMGVTIEDCAKASRYLEECLEQEEVLPENYVLEVSSPGVERPLVRPKDWERFVGEPVVVQTHSQSEWKKSRFEGRLLKVGGGIDSSQSAEILLKDGTMLNVQLCDVEKANIMYEW
jgi:ribosome maturation factor RimP